MSDFVSELKAAWMGARQREFHQSTRGIMTPEARRELEEEFYQRLAEHNRQVAEKAWWEACLRIANGENHLDIAHVYQKQNPYMEGAGR